MRNRNNEFLDQSEPELDSSGFDHNGVNHYQEKINRYLVITGEYLGEENVHSGPEFEKYLREVLEISLNEDDFVRKSIMGITDENNDIQAIDKEKLRTFYWKEKGEIGYLETTKQEENEISCGIGNFKPTQNRGYYSCAFSPRFGGHLVQGGKDYLTKPFNKTYYSNEYVQSVGMHVIEDYLNGDVNP